MISKNHIIDILSVCSARRTAKASCRDCCYGGTECEKVKEWYNVSTPIEALDKRKCWFSAKGGLVEDEEIERKRKERKGNKKGN